MADNQSPVVDNVHAQFVINLLLGHKMTMMMMMTTAVIVLVPAVVVPLTCDRLLQSDSIKRR